MSPPLTADVLRTLEMLGISEHDARSTQVGERGEDVRFTLRDQPGVVVIEVRGGPNDPFPYAAIRLEPAPMSAADLACWAIEVANRAYLNGIVEGEQREGRRIRADLRAYVDGGWVVPRPEEDEGPDEARH